MSKKIISILVVLSLALSLADVIMSIFSAFGYEFHEKDFAKGYGYNEVLMDGRRLSEGKNDADNILNGEIIVPEKIKKLKSTRQSKKDKNRKLEEDFDDLAIEMVMTEGPGVHQKIKNGRKYSKIGFALGVCDVSLKIITLFGLGCCFYGKQGKMCVTACLLLCFGLMVCYMVCFGISFTSFKSARNDIEEWKEYYNKQIMNPDTAPANLMKKDVDKSYKLHIAMIVLMSVNMCIHLIAISVICCCTPVAYMPFKPVPKGEEEIKKIKL